MIGELSGGLLEMKFRLPPDAVPPLLDWMRRDLRPDPHGHGEFGDAYRVQSVYLDTAAMDVFHRRGSYGRAKFRIRRYGDDPRVFLERKLKQGGRVRKRRVAVDPGALGHLEREVNGAVWPGTWFHQRMAVRGLRPVVMMDYRRVARRGSDLDGEFRVTLDRELHARPLKNFGVPVPVEGEDLFAGGAVLEVKFADALPAAVKALVETHRLEAAGFSKYRLGVTRCGLVSVPEGGGVAGLEERWAAA